VNVQMIFAFFPIVTDEPLAPLVHDTPSNS
jgi:hypothetical protein